MELKEIYGQFKVVSETENPVRTEPKDTHRAVRAAATAVRLLPASGTGCGRLVSF